MGNTSLHSLVLTGLALMAGLIGRPALGVELVRDGEPVAAIMVLEDDCAFAKHAADELQTYIHKSTGARLPINPPDMGEWENTVAVGRAAHRVDGALAQREWQEDEVFRRATADTLILTGLDEGNSVIYWSNSAVWWPKLGSLFAVYAFLREVVCVRWLFPGELGEEVPQRRSIAVEPFERLDRPAFHQRVIWSKSLSGHHDFWQWCYRNGSTPHLKSINAPHAYGRLLPPKEFMADHPDYFALWQGRRLPTQLCTTHPDVLKIVTQRVRQRFDQEPRQIEVSLSPNDNTSFCQCERCRALDIDGEDSVHGGPSVSRRVFTFVNQVARELARTHPEKKVGCYAYWAHREVPKGLELEPNVVVHFAPHAGGVAHNWYEPEQRATDVRLLTEWRQLAPEMSIHEYFGLNYGGVPRTLAWVLADELRVLQGLGIRNFTTEGFDCWAASGFDYYAMMQLFWNPHRSVSEILREWCEAMFGAAADPMEQYFLRLKRQVELTHEIEFSETFFSPDCLADLRRLIDDAGRLAPEGRHRHRVEFLEGPLRLVELTMDVVRLHEEYQKTGGKNEAAVARLAAAGRKRTDFLESLRNTRAIDFWGFRLPREYAFASNVEAFLRTGQSSFRLSVTRTDAAPSIDGVLDDPCWRTAFRAGDFIELRNGRLMDPKTDAWFASDEEGFYAAVRCHDPAAPDLADKATERDGRVWADNDVELFLQPPGSGTFFQFICNSLGTPFDARYVDDKQDVTWDPDWRWATKVSDGAWTAEIMVPWRELGASPPAVDNVWRGNIARHHAGPGVDTYSSWRPVLEGAFVQARNLGNVEFVGEPEANLLPNGGFEARDDGLPEGWAVERRDVTRPYLTRELSAVGQQSICLSMENPVMGMRQGLHCRRVKVEPDTPYTLSYHCRVEGGRDPLQMGGDNGWNALTGELVWLDVQGKCLRRDWLTPRTLRRDLWQYQQWEKTSPAGTTQAVFNMIIRNHTGKTWVDEVALRPIDQ